MPTVLLIAGLAALAVALTLLALIHRARRRERTLLRLLDLADAMQALLDRSQERMAAMKAVVGRVPADIAAVAQASLDGTQPILEAKRDVLQHRLWIQKHGETATPANGRPPSARGDRRGRPGAACRRPPPGSARSRCRARTASRRASSRRSRAGRRSPRRRDGGSCRRARPSR